VLELDGLPHALLVVEADEALDVVGTPDVFGDLAGEDVACGAEVRGQVFGLGLTGQVLDEHIELVDDLGVLDLPHEPELLLVQRLLVFVEERTFGFFHIVKVDLPEPE